jgi:hypothetical protein
MLNIPHGDCCIDDENGIDVMQKKPLAIDFLHSSQSKSIPNLDLNAIYLPPPPTQIFLVGQFQIEC